MLSPLLQGLSVVGMVAGVLLALIRKESLLRALSEMQSQIVELHCNIMGLKWCVEEDQGVEIKQ